MGIVENLKERGKQVLFSFGEMGLGVLLLEGFPVVIPTVAAIVAITRGGNRFKRALSF